MAFMTGKVKVKGDMAKVALLKSLLAGKKKAGAGAEQGDSPSGRGDQPLAPACRKAKARTQ